MPDEGRLTEVLFAFDLGPGTLSDGPVATGRLGEIWRFDTARGSWAVKATTAELSDESTRFQEAAVAAGVPAPGVRRARDGRVTADLDGTSVSVQEWVAMAGPDPSLDPASVGALLAGLHRMRGVQLPSRSAVDPWFVDPVGSARWDEVIGAAVSSRAPFGPDLAAHRDELVALEVLLASARDLLWCHRDLFCDNVRARPGGGLVVFDFDNSGPCDPSWELAFVLVEYATTSAPIHAKVDVARARVLYDAYVDGGGPGRLRGTGDFTMAIAVLGHLGELATRRWLAATDSAERDDLAAWAAELTERPLTRQVIADLLDAV